MRSINWLAVPCAAIVSVAATPAMASTTVYNSTPAATFYFGNSTDYSPANAAVLTTDTDQQIFARWHERVPGPGGSNGLAPASVGSVYSFALGTPGLSFDFGITGFDDALLKVSNLGTGANVSFNFSDLPDNAVSGNSLENSENLLFAFLSGVGFDPNANNTYRLTLTAGGESLKVDAQVGTGAVPETATWAMMLCGFGMVGNAIRRRKVALRFA